MTKHSNATSDQSALSETTQVVACSLRHEGLLPHVQTVMSTPEALEETCLAAAWQLR